ncbi:MAG: AAA family ATPase [Alphaproteobacteria bacterium]|nr:AAA family ATPase [Alphaproteobacteria bacterium]
MSETSDYVFGPVIHAGERSTVYRGTHGPSGREVVLKRLSAESASNEDLARFRYALELSSSLVDLDGVVPVVELVEHRARPVLVMHDLGGVDLAQALAAGRMDLREGLHIAVQVTRALAGLHARDLIHLDVNPANIIRNPATGQTAIIDFDLASRLGRERAAPIKLAAPRGTLAYIAPEQTGRTNRAVDRRADLYSLGVTLFELFTGRLPFPHTDPLTLVHHHLAVSPPSPRGLEATIPAPLSALILRLLEKMPEDRYQTADGVLADLEHCLSMLEETGDIPDFPLGVHDAVDGLMLSQRLYGREDELAELMNAFADARNGHAVLMTIAGYSGVGKSSLVREVHGPIVEARGRFAAGKYQQLQRAPYLGLLEAMRDLVDDVLSLPPDQIALWRAALTDALGSAGRAVVDVVPDAAWLLGDLPPLPPVGHTEAQNRFQRALVRFLATFARADAPLVLYLDDLQWADSNSLGVVKLLLQDPQTHNVLVIGSYRSNEVGPAHPVTALLQELADSDTPVRALELLPLPARAVVELLADSLRHEPADVEPLAAELIDRTGGNPFFMEALLQALYERGALWIERGTGRWQWSLQRVDELGISDNVADLMAAGLDDLSSEVRDLLQHAACIGAAFELTTLAAATGRTPTETAELLWPALQARLVEPVGDRWHLSSLREGALTEGVVFRFRHDRVEEAAYGVLSEGDRAARHLALGRVLRDGGGNASLFSVVDQLDLGRSLVTDPDERLDLARRNHAAAGLAMANAAYSRGRQYAVVARELLGEAGWTDHAALLRELLQLHADASLMAGFHGESEAIARELEAHAETLAQKVEALKRRLNVDIHGGDRDRCLATFAAAMQVFGMQPPTDADGWQALAMQEAMAVMPLLEGVDIEGLIDRPMMTDPDAMVQMDMWTSAAPVTLSFPPLAAVLFPRMVALSLEHGNTWTSPIAYVFYGVLRGLFGDWATGDAFGRLALALNERQGLTQLRPPVQHIYACFTSHWTGPLSRTLQLTREAMVAALENGIFNTAAWAGMNLPWLELAAGGELGPLIDETRDLQRLAQNTLKYKDAATSYLLCLHAAAGLAGDRALIEELDAAGHTEDALRAELEHYPMALCGCETNLLQRAVVMGDLQSAGALAGVIGPRLEMAAGLICMSEYVFLAALTLLDLKAVLPPEQWAPMGGQLDQLCGHLDGFAANNPGEHGWRKALIDASRAAADGADPTAVRERFDDAVAAAEALDNPYAEALCLERAYQYLAASGRDRMARGYLADARFAYVRWGARAKVEALEAVHPVLRSRRASSATMTTTDTSVLDVETVLRATRAISSETDLDDLLQAVLRVVLEHAGAQRGFLVIDRGGVLSVDAAGDEAGTRALEQVPLGSDAAALCEEAVRYVARSGATLAEDDALLGRFRHTPYVRERRPRSLLVMPLLHLSDVVGVLYLENNLTTGAFSGDHLQLLHTVAVQAATSIQNAELVEDLKERSAELERRSQQLLSRNEQLTEVDRVRDEFLAKTSHELRTPLHGIIGLAQSLLDGRDQVSAAELRQSLGMIASSGHRLNSLINDILDFSTLKRREIELSLAPVDLREVVAEVVALASPLRRSDAVALRTVLPDGPVVAMADRDRVAQVLFNLVGNACKFTESGAVTVELSGDEDEVQVAVSDTGVGIRAAVLDRIFDAFEQGDEDTQRRFGGTGLGLAVGRELVELHGGRMGVRSEVGVGSTFTFTLPATDEAPGSQAAAASARVVRAALVSNEELVTVAPVTTGQRRTRVLVIDDEPVNLQVTLNHLGRAGYEVYTARGGPEALRRLGDGLEPDIVLLDLMMPGMDGYEVCRRLRETRSASDLPVIMLTARGEVGNLVKGIREGVNDYLVKPFSSEELLARMRNHLHLATIHHAVGRFVPYDFMRLLDRESIVDVRLGDSVKRDMSVMFADIRGFTTLTGTMSPERSFAFINGFLGVMEPVIREHGGFVDKFIGDGIMALFDAGADGAVAAGVGMLHALTRVNEENGWSLRIGIGVNSGDTMLGTVGGAQRMDTTVISDTVNVASRVEGLNKGYGSGLLITEHTRDRLAAPDRFRMRRLERVVVRGKTEPVDVFEVLDGLPDDVAARRFAARGAFERGVAALQADDAAAALAAFEQARDLDTDDPATAQYLRRCQVVLRG